MTTYDTALVALELTLLANAAYADILPHIWQAQKQKDDLALLCAVYAHDNADKARQLAEVHAAIAA